MPTNNLPTVAQWRRHFSSRGLDKDTIDIYISYIRPIVKRDIPVIFDLDHLAKLLGRTKEYVAKALSAPEYFYRRFEIPKKSGGKRVIEAPHQSLLLCQQWINNFILKRLPTHPSAVGYSPGLSVRNHAHPHLGEKEVLVVDLKDFFPSIKLARVIALFQDLGYTNEVSVALAKLCCLHGALPQGAATSSSLCNLICRRLDFRLNSLSKNAGVSYTRYADDMCFSALEMSKNFFINVMRICSSEGFSINERKTRKYSKVANLKLVTGINVATNELKLPKSYTRELKLHLFHIEKHGLLSHMAKRKIRDSNYLERLRGKIDYWLSIEPTNTDALHYKGLIQQLLMTQRI